MSEVGRTHEATGQILQALTTQEPQLLQFTQATKGLRQGMLRSETTAL